MKNNNINKIKEFRPKQKEVECSICKKMIEYGKVNVFHNKIVCEDCEK